jgi:hypothetical protein
MVKKKSKYRSVLINKKRYYFYKITWLDILGDAGHADSDEFNKMKPAEMITFAYIFSKDKNMLKNIFHHMITHLSLFQIEMCFQ